MTNLPNIDADLYNADWLRTRSWDLPTAPAEFKAHLQRTGQTIEQFMQKPAARAMPEELMQALSVPVVAHLPGQHDQQGHAGDGRVRDDTPGSSLASDSAASPRMEQAVSVVAANTKQFIDEEEGEIQRISSREEAEVRAAEVMQMIEDAGIHGDTGVEFTIDALTLKAEQVFVAGNFAGVAGALAVNIRGAEEGTVPVAYVELLGATGLAPGAGSALVKEAAKWAAERDLPLVGNPIPKAVPFWEKLGWHADPTQEGLETMGWTVEETKEIARS